jgi:hypothetical protein
MKVWNYNGAGRQKAANFRCFWHEIGRFLFPSAVPAGHGGVEDARERAYVTAPIATALRLHTFVARYVAVLDEAKMGLPGQCLCTASKLFLISGIDVSLDDHQLLRNS